MEEEIDLARRDEVNVYNQGKAGTGAERRLSHNSVPPSYFDFHILQHPKISPVSHAALSYLCAF